MHLSTERHPDELVQLAQELGRAVRELVARHDLLRAEMFAAAQRRKTHKARQRTTEVGGGREAGVVLRTCACCHSVGPHARSRE